MSLRIVPLSWCTLLLWITITVKLSQCSTIAAFMYAPIGTQVFVSNTTSGEITYSMCNSNGTPIFPTNPPLSLPTISKPKNGTSVAAVGWFYETTWADVMYQDEGNNLVAVRYQCNMTTGQYFANTNGFPNDPLADVKAPRAHDSTGLAGLILSSTDGERWLYHDNNMQLQAVHYINNGGTNGQWKYEGPVSPDQDIPGRGIGIAMTPTNENATVVFPKDSKNIEVSNYNLDTTWHISTFPSSLINASTTTWTSNSNTTLTVNSSDVSEGSLTGWDGSTNSMGFTIDTSLTRSVFYIDSNKTLQMATSSTKNGESSPWALAATSFTSNGTWPSADVSDADFGIASNPQSYDIRIYYISGGVLTQVSRSSQFGWDAAIAVPPINTTATSPAPPSNSTVAAAASNSGLSTGASAGIGVGVGIAGLAIIGVGVFFFLRRRRNRRAHDNERIAAANAAAGQMGPNHYNSAHNSQQYNQYPYGDQYAQQYDQNGAPVYYQPDKNPEMMQQPEPIGELGTTYEESHELPASGTDPKHQGVHYVPSEGQVSPTPAYAGIRDSHDPNLGHVADSSHEDGSHLQVSNDGQYADESGSYISHTQPTSPALSHGQVSPAPRYSSLSYHNNNLSSTQDYGGDELHIYSEHGSPVADAPPGHDSHQG